MSPVDGGLSQLHHHTFLDYFTMNDTREIPLFNLCTNGHDNSVIGEIDAAVSNQDTNRAGLGLSIGTF